MIGSDFLHYGERSVLGNKTNRKRPCVEGERAMFKEPKGRQGSFCAGSKVKGYMMRPESQAGARGPTFPSLSQGKWEGVEGLLLFLLPVKNTFDYNLDLKQGWSSVLPTADAASKWSQETPTHFVALEGQPTSELGPPPPADMSHVVPQPTLTVACFCNLGQAIIFPFDSKYLGEMAGEIKVIQVINENANHKIGRYKGRPTLMCCNMQFELAEE